ncbi:MAG: geranylgeranyl reductase family protein, partial [Candidatus Bathyarchaeia archaeon]
MKHDIVIVGAGAAGCVAAYFLAKQCFNVVLVERKPQEKIGVKVCGDAVGEHHFKNIGIEPPKLGEDATLMLDNVRVFSPNKRYYVDVYGSAYALDRHRFGQRLLRMAQAAGAALYDQHRVVEPIIKGHTVQGVKAQHETGKTIDIMGKITVDASGATAVVRNKLPLGWWISEKTAHEDYNIGYREILETREEINAKHAMIYLSQKHVPGGYWWFFPKGRNIVNVGLGVQWKQGYHNPKTNYFKHVRPQLPKIVHVISAGGAIVPTRRPISCMVWNGFVVVGDAACTANPIHGGGIGPAMMSAYQAAKTIEEALSSGEPTIEALWSYPHGYIRAYGAKQASLDILRRYLQQMSDDDLDFVLERGIVNSKELSGIGYQGELRLSVVTKTMMALRLLERPSLLVRLKEAKEYMDKARDQYLNYPEKPKEFLRWRQETE